MKQMLIIVVIVFALLAAGCSDSAKDLYDTAQLEELQNNPQHARELYQEIVHRYPDSSYGKKAAERLAELK